MEKIKSTSYNYPKPKEKYNLSKDKKYLPLYKNL